MAMDWSSKDAHQIQSWITIMAAKNGVNTCTQPRRGCTLLILHQMATYRVSQLRRFLSIQEVQRAVKVKVDSEDC